MMASKGKKPTPNDRDAIVDAAVEEVIAEASTAGAVIIPFDPDEADVPEPQEAEPERERRTWPCAEEERDLCDMAAELLEKAEKDWNQANARHNGRFQTAVNRTRKKVEDMPEINTAAGPNFFLVGLKDGEWREIFQNEVQRG